MACYVTPDLSFDYKRGREKIRGKTIKYVGWGKNMRTNKNNVLMYFVPGTWFTAAVSIGPLVRNLKSDVRPASLYYRSEKGVDFLHL